MTQLSEIPKITTHCLGEQDPTGAWRPVVEVYIDGELKERKGFLPIFQSEDAAKEVAKKLRRDALHRWYRTLGIFVELG